MNAILRREWKLSIRAAAVLALHGVQYGAVNFAGGKPDQLHQTAAQHRERPVIQGVRSMFVLPGAHLLDRDGGAARGGTVALELVYEAV